MIMAELDIGWILSVCVFVCVLVQLFAGRFLDQFEQEFNCNFMKRALKNGSCYSSSIELTHFRATSGLPRSLHSPQVATAAPPSPLGLVGGVAVGDLHLWRHLPPRVQF